MADIEMTIDAVREIANRTMETLKQQAQASARRFGDVELPPSAFGGWQQGVALGRHHQGAHDVFMKTIEGVVADLEEFAQKLRDTADSSEKRDQEVEAALLALGRGYRDRTFRSDRNYTATVEAQSGRKGVDAEVLAAEAAAAEAAERATATAAEHVPVVDGGQGDTVLGDAVLGDAVPGDAVPGDASAGQTAGDTPLEPVRPSF
jgi:hypothetical protein